MPSPAAECQEWPWRPCPAVCSSATVSYTHLDVYKRQVKGYLDRIMPRATRRGYVSVQFEIRRDGAVGKVSFAQGSGDPVLDRTAIEAISGGGPFGPLPARYKDSVIHVQMNFAFAVPVK